MRRATSTDKVAERYVEASRFWYHGTERAFDTFKVQEGRTFGTGSSKTPLFFSPDESFAKGWGPNILKVRLKWRKVFDPHELVRTEPPYWPPDRVHLTREGQVLYDDLASGSIWRLTEDEVDEAFAGSYDLFAMILRGDYDVLETAEFKRWLKRRSYDAAFVTGDGPKNVFVFSPSQVEIVDAYPR